MPEIVIWLRVRGADLVYGADAWRMTCCPLTTPNRFSARRKYTGPVFQGAARENPHIIMALQRIRNVYPASKGAKRSRAPRPYVFWI